MKHIDISSHYCSQSKEFKNLLMSYMVQASYLKLGDVLFRFSGFREKF